MSLVNVIVKIILLTTITAGAQILAALAIVRPYRVDNPQPEYWAQFTYCLCFGIFAVVLWGVVQQMFISENIKALLRKLTPSEQDRNDSYGDRL